MKVIWLPLALRDLAGIEKYYHKVAGKAVAHKQLRKIAKSANLRQSQPYMGRINADDMDDDVLEWHIPSTSHALPYMVVDAEIQILRVLDERQARPDFWQ